MHQHNYGKMCWKRSSSDGKAGKIFVNGKIGAEATVKVGVATEM
jgi:hypothetical protein